MHAKAIHQQLTDALQESKRIEYHGIVLYLIDEPTLKEILALELSVRNDNLEAGREPFCLNTRKERGV
jgi:hypothetical protein